MTRCRKVRYRNHLAAKIALASSYRNSSSRRQEVSAYWCRDCSGWHLTSQREAR